MFRAESQPNYSEALKPQEECGVTGIFSKSGRLVSTEIPTRQELIKNRGQDTSGMAVWLDGKLNSYTGPGIPSEVFPADFDFSKYNLVADRGIGHNRYATDGGNSKDDLSGAQPMVVEWNGRSLAIAYNGNLPERERRKLKDRIPEELPKEPNFDTADIGRAIITARGSTWEEKIENGLRGVVLAYSLTLLTDTGELFGLRCPAGTWPLWVGEGEDLILFSSETRIDKSPDIKWREVKPGELVKSTKQGVESSQIFPQTKEFRCALHDMYGARKDSIMAIRDGKPVTFEDFRREAGRTLARLYPFYDADTIIGIPETGIAIAEGYAEVLGKKATTDVIVKIDSWMNGKRAFIGKNDDEIHAVINGKLAYIEENKHKVEGKNVVLIDDSNIRGKSAGGHPLKNPDGTIPVEELSKRVFGYIDHIREMKPKRTDVIYALEKFVDGCDSGYFIIENQLVAVFRESDGEHRVLSEDEIAIRFGVDSVHYITAEALEETYQTVLGRRDVACTACMGGVHPLDQIENRPIFAPSELAHAAAD